MIKEQIETLPKSGALDVVATTETERFILNGLRRLDDGTADFILRFVELRVSRLPKRPALRVIAGGAK